MQFRRFTRRLFAAAVAPLLLLAATLVVSAAAPVRADLPVVARVIRALKSVPADADAIRFSVYGDGTGATLALRLLALGNNGPAVAGSANYYQGPPLVLDFKGWKTVTVSLADLVFRAEQAPGASADAAFPLRFADTVEFALTGTAARIFVEDVAWARGSEAPLSVIDDFDSGTLAARAVGTYAQVQATTVSLNRVAAFVRSGTGSLQVAVVSRASRERSLYAPGLLARLKRAPAAATYPYVVYSRPPFEPIVPESVPAPTEVGTIPGAPPQIRIFACADEVEPASFAVFAGRDIRNASVAVATDFTADGGQGRFSRVAADVHVVKVWEQAGLGPFAEPARKQPITLGELLVKDDRVSLSGPQPSVRLVGNAITDIPENTSKQFWVTVRVPRGQAPGLYRGRLLFSAPNVKPTAIPLAIEVLPLRLRSAFLQYGVDLRSRVGGASGDRTVALPADSPRVSEEEFARELADIRDHGFRWVSLYDAPADLGNALRLYKESGLNPSGPVVVMTGANETPRIEAARAQAGLPNLQVYLGTPLTNPNQAAEALGAGRSSGSHAPLVGLVVGAGLEPSLLALVDVPVFSVGADYPQTLLATGKRTNTKRDWWSWNLAQENAPLNRLYAGFLLYRTGFASAPFYGAFAGPYRYAPPGVDPFNEATTPGETLRPQMVTYPVQNGLLSTLQWEAAREGVDDIRYITTLKDFIRQLKDAQTAKGVVTGKAAVSEAEAFLVKSAGGDKPLIQLTPGELQALRRGIADRALKLLNLVRSVSGDRSIN